MRTSMRELSLWHARVSVKMAVFTVLAVLSVPCRAEDAAEVADLRARVAQVEKDRDLEENGKARGLLGPVLIGPNVTILQLPTGPTFGLEVKGHRLWGVSFDYGFIPKVNVAQAKVSFDAWTLAAKVFPFRGAFFVGAGYGHYKLTGETQQVDSNTGISGSAKAEVSSYFIEPGIGWRWVRPGGFFTGLDLSWQFPVGYKSTVTAPDLGSLGGTVKDIQENADKYLKRGLPSLGFLRLGWFI